MSTKYTKCAKNHPILAVFTVRSSVATDRQVTEVYMLHALALHTHLANVLARYMAITYLCTVPCRQSTLNAPKITPYWRYFTVRSSVATDRQVTEVYMLHALARHTHFANVLAWYMAISYT